MKAGYYVEIAGYYLAIEQVLSDDLFQVEIGFVTDDGCLKREESRELTAKQVEQWEREVREERDKYENKIMALLFN